MADVLEKVLVGKQSFESKMNALIAAVKEGGGGGSGGVKTYTKSVIKDSSGEKITITNVVDGVTQTPFDFAGGSVGKVIDIPESEYIAGMLSTETYAKLADCGFIKGVRIDSIYLPIILRKTIVSGNSYQFTATFKIDSNLLYIYVQVASTHAISVSAINNDEVYVKLPGFVGVPGVETEPYHFPYNAFQTLEPTRLVVTLQTLTLDNKKTKKEFPFILDQATGANEPKSTAAEANFKIGLLGFADRNQIYQNKKDIETIILASDVKDVVAVYGTTTGKTSLQDYDITTLTENDIILVLSDSEHEDRMSYYKYNGSTGAFPAYFDYLGSLSGFYTKTQADATFIKFSGSGSGKITGDLSFEFDGTETSKQHTVTGLKDPNADRDAVPYLFAKNNFMKKIGKATATEEYHFPFNIRPLEVEETYIKATFDTVTLDGNETKKSYDIVLQAASDTKAGLMSKADKVKLNALQELGLSIVDGAINITYEA